MKNKQVRRKTKGNHSKIWVTRTVNNWNSGYCRGCLRRSGTEIVLDKDVKCGGFLAKKFRNQVNEC